MPKDWPDDPNAEALVVHAESSLSAPRAHQGGAVQRGGQGDASGQVIAAGGPPAPVRRAIPEMLYASAEAFGAVVHTLLHDLDQVSATVQELGWLSLTPTLLEYESSFQHAVRQMKQWEGFIATLPNPHLFSERAREERRKLERLHARAQLLGREQALVDHRRLIEAEAAQSDRQTALALRRGADDPESIGWRVNPQAYVDAHLVHLPPLTPIVPILAADVHPEQNAAGYNATLAMRRHPELAAGAQQLDAALTEVLRREIKLPKKLAAAHAHALTGIFLLAMMRALRAGDMQLATSVRFMVPADAQAVSKAFGEELLRSWVAHLEALPMPPEKKAWGARLKGLLGMGSAAPEALPEPEGRLQIGVKREE